MQGTWTTLVGIIAVCFYFDMQFPKDVQAFLMFAALTTWLIGASIGYTFPEGYRRRVQRLKSRKDRRLYSRTALMESGRLALGKYEPYECNIVNLSLGGAAVDVTVPDPVGAKAELELSKIGKVSGWIVRKEDKKTSLQLTPSKDKANQLIDAYNI